MNIGNSGIVRSKLSNVRGLNMVEDRIVKDVISLLVELSTDSKKNMKIFVEASNMLSGLKSSKLEISNAISLLQHDISKLKESGVLTV
ncbi:MAG: hypothetical protein WC755_05925 [Candidatus Woesearchaeota archaeon]